MLVRLYFGNFLMHSIDLFRYVDYYGATMLVGGFKLFKLDMLEIAHLTFGPLEIALQFQRCAVGVLLLATDSI